MRFLTGAVVDPGGEGGELVHHHHDQRLIRGRSVEPGDAEQPVLTFPHYLHRILEQLGEGGFVAAGGFGVAAGEPGEEPSAWG